jgi:uncharacterized protein
MRRDEATPASGATEAEEVCRLLQLEPHATCGLVRLSYVSTMSIASHALPAPFAGVRPLGSALYFMVTPAASVRLHRIRNDQLYHYYLGDPIEVLVLRRDGAVERVVVGPNLRAGQRVQLLIPGDTFHAAQLIGGRWFLGASTEWPGVTSEDVESDDAEALAQKYPALAAGLREIAAAGERARRL